jgi:Holliday junction resolvase RusA-like endonuclease
MDLFKQNIFDESFELGDGFITISFFLKYRKGKRTPQAINPVPKQSFRYGIRVKGGVKPITKTVNLYGKNVVKEYYALDELYTIKYEDSLVKHNEEYIAEQIKLKLLQYPEVKKHLPFTSLIAVEKLVFIFAPIKSMKANEKKTIEAGGFVYKYTKPDMTDNLPKLLFDAMDGLIYENDSRICKENNIYKVYGNTPGVFIKIKAKI